ncbi:prolyl oligopeptidase family serine peptidase [Candidatus Poribacteria bacterium]|jgi:predicted peptidase|nr:prolyl oligopeptidase family serine peptidase [Candidatus Poribacteria bacterium]MBT5534332.1 prolyl oligopeptidase family serine peptidase [Candidatus Poribacteria bacterium]MBT5710613.1 prolyl oligopeptidase family serine peptidase [Candidatus Poribacteria bacterium]MBT7101551.1 prolyl oligopeptidase family serine peptidase [Candidatus Poribacteria bacterium]MBT7805906.1 prolyl oligopeptidase family serine peptidase [Candidatus Poribacteria bacterium]
MLRRSLTILTVASVLGLTGITTPSVAQDPAPGAETPQTFRHVAAGEATDYGYKLFLPDGYTPDAAGGFPLIYNHHGAGGNGSNLGQIGGAAVLVRGQADFPFIVLSPQVPRNPDWNIVPEALLALLDDVASLHNVDETRIYMTGFSQGGFLTWVLGMMEPERFAALAPVAGGTNLMSLCRAMRSVGVPCGAAPDTVIDACVLTDVPIWAFHGSADTIVRPLEAQTYVDALASCSGNAQMTLTPGLGHSTGPAYVGGALVDWFASHQRAPEATAVDAGDKLATTWGGLR